MRMAVVNSMSMVVCDLWVTHMKMFIAHSENDPNVLKQFEKQLEMREQVRWKKDDEKLREEQRQKAMENPFEEPPKKKPVSKRISRSKVKWQF